MEMQIIRTFGRIHGKKLSTRQQWLVDNLLPQLSPLENERIVSAPAILEIGFGGGEHLLHIARKNPNSLIIGAEPFINGVASLLTNMTTAPSWACKPENEPCNLYPVKPEYKNIRIWPDDARKLLTGDYELTTIYILHPDPWPKARHEKRRLLNTEFLKSLRTHLSKGGKIIFGTDHTDYFNWVLTQIPDSGLEIENTEFTNPPEDGLDTRYQQKNKFGSEKPMYLVLTHSH